MGEWRNPAINEIQFHDPYENITGYEREQETLKKDGLKFSWNQDSIADHPSWNAFTEGFNDENLFTTGTLTSGNLSVTGTGSFSSTISTATGSTSGDIVALNSQTTHDHRTGDANSVVNIYGAKIDANLSGSNSVVTTIGAGAKISLNMTNDLVAAYVNTSYTEGTARA